MDDAPQRLSSRPLLIPARGSSHQPLLNDPAVLNPTYEIPVKLLRCPGLAAFSIHDEDVRGRNMLEGARMYGPRRHQLVAEGKIVIDTTVPLMPPKVARVQLPPEGSAAQRAQNLLGEDVRLVSAFHNVAAHKLATDQIVDCDVLVFGDDKPARAVAVELADCAGLRGLHAGVLANAAAAEALTSILIFINKNYKVDGAGIRITGALDISAAAD